MLILIVNMKNEHSAMDVSIIKKLKKGDRNAFKLLFEHHYVALCSFANKYMNDMDASEDMIQEVFIQFWEKHQDFDHVNAIKSYLYTSVRNKCLNHLKHQTVVQKSESHLIYELESEQFFKNHVIEEETFNQLFIEIRNLPAAAQEIMLLALNGLKNQEIADELNISVNTVKTQKKIAYSKLKDKISPVLGGILLSF